MSVRRKGAFVALLLWVAGCSDESDAARLLEPDALTPQDIEERRRLMNVRVIDVQGAEIELTPTEFVAEVTSDCEVILLAEPANLPGCSQMVFDNPPTTCGEDLCHLHLELCIANRLMEIAETVAPVEVGTLTVPPQSVETNAGLEEQAIEASREAILIAGKELRNAVGRIPAHPTAKCSSTQQLTPTFGQGPNIQSYGESYAASLHEAYDILWGASEALIRDETAAADAVFSTEPSIGKAARLAQFGPVLSRGHVTMELVGGEGTIYPYTSAEALCERPTLSGPARVALDTIHTLGMSPADLLGVDTDALLAGSLGGGSVRDRARDMFGDGSLSGSASADEVAAAFGVTVADFTEAVDHYAEHRRAFDRDLGLTMPPRPLPGGGMTSYPLFASSITKPLLSSSVEMVQRARRTSWPPVDDRADTTRETPSPPVQEAYMRRGVAQTMDYAVSIARDLVNEPAYDIGSAVSVRDILGLLATGGGRARPARLESCYRFDGTNDTVRLRVLLDELPPDPNNDILIVEGRNGLDCARAGTVDGVACDLSTYVNDGVSRTTGDAPPDSGFDHYVEVNIVDFWSSPPTYYAVRRRSDALARTAGSYEPIGGITLMWGGSTPSWLYCALSPEVTEINEAAGDVITPSTESCIEPATGCAGLPFDQRIPLEDELSEDFDSVESSWRHYLTLARQAATEADMLGEELIGAGLGMDERAEGAVEELEGLCGAAINTDDLFAAPVRDGAACSAAAPCGGGYECVGTTCVRDLVAMAESRAPTESDANRLRECLGDSDDQIIDYVTLGTTPLCIWRNITDKNRICEGAGEIAGGARRECPFLPTSGTCIPSNAPPGVETVLVTTNLGLFDSSIAGSDHGGVVPCDLLRKLRNPSTSATDRARFLDEIKATGFFQPSQVRAIAERLGFEARLGDFSAVTLGGGVWISNGDLRRGPRNTVWPCTAAPPPDCTTGGAGLFCDSYNCNTSRPELNDRLGRAVLAARISTGLGLDNVFLPWVYDGSSATMTNVSDSIADDLRVFWDGRVESIAFAGGGSLSGGAPIRASCFSATSPQVGWTSLTLTPGTGTYVPLGHYTWCDANLTDTVATAAFLRQDAGVVVFPGSPERSTRIGSAIWSGLTFSPRTRVAGFDALALDALSHPGTPDRWQVVIGPSTPNVGDLTKYFRYISDDPLVGRYHDAAMAANGFTRRDLADAAELMCEAARGAQPSCDLLNPPLVESAADLGAAQGYMNCVADYITMQAGRTVLPNMPARAVTAISRTADGGGAGTSSAGGAGGFPYLGGDYSKQVARIRIALIQLSGSSLQIASFIREVANDVDRLRLALTRNELAREMADVRLYTEMYEAAVACGSALAGATSGDFAGAGQCAASLGALSFAQKLNDLTHEDLQLAAEESVLDYKSAVEHRLQALHDESTAISTALEELNAGLAGIESIRAHGTRLLAKASFADSDAAGRHYQVNTVMRRRYNTLERRYQEARDDAVRMSYLAKLAIEQRLGMRLRDIREDLSLVEAPARWEASVCTMTGIDYERIRDAGSLPADNYANGYIGDYVRKLERVVESYRLDFPFHEGTDTAVISLRDEIQNVRDTCRDGIEVENLLLHASDFGHPPDDTGYAGWDTIGAADCRNCVSASALPAPDPADPTLYPPPFDIFTTPNPELGTPSGYRVEFGTTVVGAPSDLSASTRLGQRVDLGAGRYRLSWYGRTVLAGGTTLSAPQPDVAVEVVDGTGAVIPFIGTMPASDPPADGWTRYWALFDLGAADTVTVQIAPELDPMTGAPVVGAVDLAAPMLEDVSDRVIGDASSVVVMNWPPIQFADTADTRLATLPMCEDTDGDVFRARGWTRRCEFLCSDGFARACSTGSGTRRCFWETTFNISQSQIEGGRMIHSAGFARGNYNYRIDGLGLNFVGTATRDCADEVLASTCYSAGYVPYTIEHQGPYTVRNHKGEDYEAPLFIGRIEHGRGLASERYLTNPISSADRALIEPYVRRELRGRPLDGTYVLRVWDETGVNFHGIEDVQILLEYRYWTRFE